VWMPVCRKCCVLSGSGLCDELITRPEESYRLRCVVVCNLETSWMRRTFPTGGCYAKNKEANHIWYIIVFSIYIQLNSFVFQIFLLCSYNVC